MYRHLGAAGLAQAEFSNHFGVTSAAASKVFEKAGYIGLRHANAERRLQERCAAAAQHGDSGKVELDDLPDQAEAHVADGGEVVEMGVAITRDFQFELRRVQGIQTVAQGPRRARHFFRDTGISDRTKRGQRLARIPSLP